MKRLAFVIAAAAVLLSGCGTSSSSSVSKDQAQTDSQLARYQANQPIPASDWSQYRQTVIDVEQAQIHGMATTTFFYNLGIAKPDSCPSIGFPVPTTAQLTNPDQLAWKYDSNFTASGTVAQAEPNGVYTGPSSGTYVVCIDPLGRKYIQYWEGDVKTVGGPAHWDPTTQTIQLDGAPTVKVTTR